MTDKIIKIAILDDHKIVRDGIRALMLAYPELEIVAESYDAEQMLTFIKGSEAEILLLDLMLPGMDGVSLAEILKTRLPELKILVLTSNTDEVSIIRAVQAGVKGYVSKDASGVELIKALRTVADGEEYFGETISAIIFKSYMSKNAGGSASTKRNNEQLTDREKDVIRCFGNGLSYKETAAELCLSPRTVETHRNTIMEKLGLHSLAELIKFAIRTGIVKL
ncbi:MAG TPA: response regulator transcription factor [Bacteroidales bacterium]|nr:response regulator transcription factor [Bacteroidales bacterium]